MSNYYKIKNQRRKYNHWLVIFQNWFTWASILMFWFRRMEMLRLLYILIMRLKNIWITLRDPYKRPARSPDLNYYDFFYRGYMEETRLQAEKFEEYWWRKQKILRASLSIPVDMLSNGSRFFTTDWDFTSHSMVAHFNNYYGG